MLDTEVAAWLSNCTESDVRKLLEKVERSYTHPYGFTVYRLAVHHLAPWNVRVHFWPSSLECYDHLRHNRTESQLVHAHGWDLFSFVASGELEERTYELQADHDGDFALYETRSDTARGFSILEAKEERLTISETEKRVRRPDLGAYSILSGTYHSTLPATRSISLVAAKQSVGQTSKVAVYRGSDKQIANAAPQQSLSKDLPSSSTSPPNNWSSFVFFVHADQILLVRTAAQPEQWQPVGGQRDAADSSPIDTLIREVHEEVGVRLDPTMTRWIGARKADLGTGVVCFWIASSFAFDKQLSLQLDEILEARWWNIAQARLLPMYQASADTLRDSVVVSERASDSRSLYVMTV
jgi:8-oxo-dGTP diphosphatase